MTENLSAYIPMDRRMALAQGETLAESTRGAALFADISGFTPLTEALAEDLGARRGAEELSNHLNRVFEALINQLHRYRGSVIGFAGDAITCWIDQDDGLRGVAAALAMQETMTQFSEVTLASGKVVSLGIKVAVVTGPVRRFMIGDPDYRVMDVMAGRTLEELAAAEHQAERGEIIVDETTAKTLGDQLEIQDWKTDEITGKRYALVSGLTHAIAERPWPELPLEDLDGKVSKAWLLPRVYERLKRGMGEFLAELRPVVALFLRFSGIDFDEDQAAPEKLDAILRVVEDTLREYDGSNTHLTVGDKGSFFCIVFGAPISHEDNAIRAASAALILQEELCEFDFIDCVQIGITQGRLWTGPYGGSKRRAYDILGDDANLAARLMMKAEPGQILVTDRIRNDTGENFNWETLERIRVKGKTHEIPICLLLSKKIQRATKLWGTRYSLPMVGRTGELRLIRDRLKLAQAGMGQIIGITSEAGLGKSRLAAEAVQAAEEMGYQVHGGECQSYGSNTSYQVWHSILRSYFGLDPSMTRQGQVQVLEGELIKINPSLLPRLPLLGTALNIPIPDNDLTDSLNAKVKKASLESMLVECLQAGCKTNPILLVLEDCHWMDPLSHDLLEVVGRASAIHSIAILVIYRPPELEQVEALRLSVLPHFTEINLVEFTPQEADQLIKMKMAQFFGAGAAVSPTLLDRITTQAAGNPFYIEELLNYLQGLDIDPSDEVTLSSMELPGSITNLILSRIDQLTEGQQITLKVASVIGRLFPAAMVWGIYPKLGAEQKVLDNLKIMRNLELTVLDTPEPELTYIFKHIFTQEVAYHNLPYATQAMLHETIGEYIEGHFRDTLDEYTNILAHHYERSENTDKKRHYFLKAGEAAQKKYANKAAIDYYQKVIPLLPDQEQVKVKLNLGKVLELIGDWHKAGNVYQEVRKLARTLGDIEGEAWVETALAEFSRKQGRFDESSKRLQLAKNLFHEIDDLAGLGQVVHYQGTIADQQGDYEKAQELMQESLEIRQKIGDKRQSAYLLGNMGIVARRQGNLNKARALYEQSLALRREINDRWGVANVLNNLGNLLLDLGEKHNARRSLEEAVAIHKELGDRWAIGNALNNLANVLRTQGDYAKAKDMYDDSLAIYRDLGDRWALAYLFEDVAWLAALQGEGKRAARLRAAGAVLRERINAPLTSREAEKLNAALKPALDLLGEEEIRKSEGEGKTMSLEEAILYALG